MYNIRPNQAPLPPRQSSSVYNQQAQGYDNSVNNTKKKEQSYQLYQQKLKALGRIRYKNQLAQLQYEDKLTQLHTKYSSKTKQSVQKKLKAKNQIAQFIDEEQQEFQQQFQELMDFKYGASKWKDFHFQRESSNKQYCFCSLCDQIHKETNQQHQLNCKYLQLAKSPLYYFQSLDRIKNSLKRLTSQEASQLSNLTDRIRKSQNVSKNLQQIMPVIKNDQVLGKIAGKLQQIIEQIL